MYPSGQSTNIGTLLRMIREDQNKGIAATPPAAQPGSPIRDVIQGPVASPEDPGSSRVISIRPEGATQSGPDIVQGATPVAPASPVTPSVVAPLAAPVAPAPTSAPASAPSAAPSQPGRSSAPSAPSIGTTIRASVPQAVLGASTKAKPSNTFIPAPGAIYHTNFTPQRSRIGVPVSSGKGIIPTPTPAPYRSTPKGATINSGFYRA